ncbi:hypothetical protein XELAEV_18002764mg [Xenopus laevis]|uniref:Uncharacterized protein n=1 Tax=Xenopus laevis TaxID=8355 RepID=A0A974GYT2_XENLA|nr:hypothetical protein XELAEV_18002764mg [Xenopus laevis]
MQNKLWFSGPMWPLNHCPITQFMFSMKCTTQTFTLFCAIVFFWGGGVHLTSSIFSIKIANINLRKQKRDVIFTTPQHIPLP